MMTEPVSMNVPSDEPNASLPSDDAVLDDRRRPGRPTYVAPALIPLLRGQPAAGPETVLDWEEPDQLSSMRGIVVAVVCSALLLACTLYLIR